MLMARTYAPNRIKELRTERGMSLEAVGSAMPADLTSSTIAKLEAGRMALSADYILQLADVFQVEPGDVIAGGGTPVRMLPVIGQVSAGAWMEAVNESDARIPVPAHLTGAKLFALYPEGDSMDRVVAPGGYIVVDPDDRELQNGKLYVLMNQHGETTFKKFSTQPLALLPCSSNDNHAPIPLGQEPFSVVGRVVYSGQEL